MRSFRLVRTVSVLSFLASILLPRPGTAYPYWGEHMDMMQPDGSTVDVVLWGNEFHIRAETPNGYTLIVDPDTHFISYAVATPDGNLVSSGFVYDGIATDAQLGNLGITPGARLSRALRDTLVAQRRARLRPSTQALQAAEASNEPEITSLAILPATTGTATGLVVLVDFPDRQSVIPIGEVESAFNSTQAYGNTWHGSIRNWSEQISDGITSVQHKVVGFYTAKYDVAHYNTPTAEWDYSTADELYKEVYAYIEANVDLTSYAINGALPSLAVVYAGDIISRGWAMALWPHGGCAGRYRTSEGVAISQCLMTNLGTRTPLNLETFRHELGHSFFHWPDTYDYDDDSKSAGGYATETDMPCAPFRMWAGWIKPYDVTSAPGVYSLAADGSTFLRYNNPGKTNEYFVAEYAKKWARRTPPDEGLLIWHIDEKGDNSWQDMTATRHYMMSVEQADGKFDLEHNVRAGAGDLFHAGDKDRFDDTTTPNSKWWDGSSSGFGLCNIGDITTDTMSVNAGCVSSGGSSSTGGAPGTGGSTGTAGSKTTGGMTSTGSGGNSGGRSNLGGASSGGIANTGGRSTTGGVGNSGGRSNTGGRSSSGGIASTGGRSSSGGVATAGGRTMTSIATAGGAANTGGQSSTSGTNVTGGIASTGGRSTASGIASTGGNDVNTSASTTRATTSAAGNSGTGGNRASTTTSVASTDVAQGSSQDTGSCSCRTVGRPNATGWASVSLLGLLGLALRRRRQP